VLEEQERERKNKGRLSWHKHGAIGKTGKGGEGVQPAERRGLQGRDGSKTLLKSRWAGGGGGEPWASMHKPGGAEEDALGKNHCVLVWGKQPGKDGDSGWVQSEGRGPQKKRGKVERGTERKKKKNDDYSIWERWWGGREGGAAEHQEGGDLGSCRAGEQRKKNEKTFVDQHRF